MEVCFSHHFFRIFIYLLLLVVPCLRKPTQRQRLSKKHWHHLKRKATGPDRMQNVKPSTAAFAYFLENLDTSTGEKVADQAKKYISEFKNLSQDKQQVFIFLL